MNHDSLRPVVHFTPQAGFLNDPNGLVKYGDTWFLFYQLNPSDTIPGNTHWGMAVSRDLLHWQHRPPAICPDDTDGCIFSGSGIVDSRNVSGLKEGTDDPILLFYTGTGFRGTPSPGQGGALPATRQCIAYSTDGGKNFRKYSGNPILPEYAPLNRDPKVNYVPECGAYVLALYIQGNAYRLFWSEDLLHWSEGQSIMMPHTAECPDLFRLPLDGISSKQKWILFGSPDNYMVGRFEDRAFIAETPLIRGSLTSRLRMSPTAPGVYAPQTYYAPDEGRVVQFSWMSTYFPGAGFHGQMSLPWELALVSTAVGPRLKKGFAREVSSLRRKEWICTSDSRVVLNSMLNDRPRFGQRPESKAVELRIETWLHEGSRFTFALFGIPVSYHHDLGVLLFPTGEFPLPTKGRLELHIVADRGGIELFACGGMFNVALNMYLDPSKPPLDFLTLEHCTLSVELYELDL